MIDRPILLSRGEAPRTRIDTTFMNRAEKPTNQADREATLTPDMAQAIDEAAKAITAVNGGETLGALRTTDINDGIRAIRQALLNLGQPQVATGFVDKDRGQVAASVTAYIEALAAAPGDRKGFERKKIDAMIREAGALLDKISPAPATRPRS